MHTYDQLIHTTTLVNTAGGGSYKSATGFFFSFWADENKKSFRICLITNKHVVDGPTDYYFDVTLNEQGKDKPEYGSSHRFNGSIDEWIMHPNKDVDLAMLPFTAKMSYPIENGRTVHVKGFTEDQVVTTDSLKELLPIEEILMVGYPTGLIDEHNNLPVVRKGITATSVERAFNGKSEFLTDCASFGGSSGSPVIRKTFSSTQGRNTAMGIPERDVHLLGVHFAGYGWTKDKGLTEITEDLSPTNQYRLPVNIGRCIRSDEILAFRDLLATAKEPTAPQTQEIIDEVMRTGYGTKLHRKQNPL